MADEPNPPIWPTSVKIFRETDCIEWMMSEIQETQDPIMTMENEDNERTYDTSGTTFTCENHFSRQRWALLFTPGVYRDMSLQVGYYVQLAGLGINASDVQFVGGKGPFVPALNKHLHRRPIVVRNNTGDQETVIRHESVGTCLDSFWRSAENFASQDLLWAVSQAAPLRRVHIRGNLHLHDGPAYASGGHLANARIDGCVYAGGQQQYLIRNVQTGRHGSDAGVVGGAWSIVLVACTTSDVDDGPDLTLAVELEQQQQPSTKPSRSNGGSNVTVIPQPRVRIEKPYIVVKSDDPTQFDLRVPRAHKNNDTSYTKDPMLEGRDDDDVRAFTRVRVVRDTEPVDRIQEALDQGKDVILAPGIFTLERSIELRQPNQVLMGLGFATIEAPMNGTPCIRVAAGVPGVRIVSVMLEVTESKKSSPDKPACPSAALLEWGRQGEWDPGREDNPGAMFDVFVRVGGATVGINRAQVNVEAMMCIHSGHVVGDNLWLWRADHALLGPNETINYPHISPIFWQCEQNEFRVETGLEVYGDDVTMYGLAVEHANGHQTVWSGERGAVHFYQCEFPYGVTRDFAEKGFRGFLIQNHVLEHDLYAPGIYSNFRNDDVFVTTAIEYPSTVGVKVVSPFTVKLDNRGGILSIANGRGGAADMKGVPVFMT